jgi:hypothetical protein
MKGENMMHVRDELEISIKFVLNILEDLADDYSTYIDSRKDDSYVDRAIKYLKSARDELRGAI